MSRPVKRRIRGRVSYIRDGVGETGREWFDLSVGLDGARTLTACCEMDDALLQRDVVATVDAQWRPVDAYVRLAVRGGEGGAAWLNFSDDLQTAHGKRIADGPFTQTIPTPRPAVFASHAVQHDAWQSAAHEPNGPARQTITGANPSPAPDGSTGPELNLTVKTLERLGEEMVRVSAGVFLCRHFRIHPEHFSEPLDMWVHGEDRILARLTWARLASTYELVELEEL